MTGVSVLNEKGEILISGPTGPPGPPGDLGNIVAVVESDYEMLPDDFAVLIATGAIDRNVKLPDPSERQTAFVKKTDLEEALVHVIPFAAEVIEGLTEFALERQGSYVELIFGDGNWHIRGNN